MNNGNFPEDSDLVEAIKQGGESMEKASSALYRRYRNTVLRKLLTTIRFRRGQQEDAEDLLHDGFLILIEKIKLDSYEPGSLPNFWNGICIGLYRNKSKRDQRTTLTDDNSQIDKIDSFDPSQRMEEKQRHGILDNFLVQLGGNCKAVMELSFAGYSMKEIANKLDLASDGMARKIKYNCKKDLIKLIKESGLEF